jgi:hypothetical protein
LLHLDIKPENLLVLGDHIKVADFGLVKELATRTQNSLVSGMTPTYAAPEIFDDEPSAQSDQYSLAIVYQEMLVGTLPFPGRTAAQLAKQHTLAEPQLTSVPASDRAALAKALAKNPTDRFASCKAFVETLIRGGNAATATPAIQPVRPVPADAPAAAPAPDDTRPQSFCATQRVTPVQKAEPIERIVTQPVRRDDVAAKTPKVEHVVTPQPIVPEETFDVEVPPTNAPLCAEQPTLYVAAGGVGIQALCRLRSMITSAGQSPDGNRLVEFVALDTDRDELRNACSSIWSSPLSPDDAIHLPLRLPSSYDNSRELLGWISRRWLYNIPRSLETRGYRPLGRLALVDNARQPLAAFEKKLQSLAAAAESATTVGAPCDTTVKVVMLAGMGGGTGSGTIIDLANAVKSRAAMQNLKVEVHAYLVFPNLANSSSTPLVAANTLSLLTELNHATIHGNLSTIDTPSFTEVFESREAPFHYVYCLPGRSRGGSALATDALDTLARYLALDRVPEARGIMQSCRSVPTKREKTRGTLDLRALGYASLSEHLRQFADELSSNFVEAVKRYWISDDTSADWHRLIQSAQPSDEGRNANLAAVDQPVSPSPDAEFDDVTLLKLRGRFEEHVSIELASGILRQVRYLSASRDQNGRQRISLKEAQKLIDLARTFAGSAPMITLRAPGNNRFSDSDSLRSLVASVSECVLRRVVEQFDSARPHQFLAQRALDGVIQDECRVVLQGITEQPESSTMVAEVADLRSMAATMLECAASDLLHCGFDRRTLVFSPHDHTCQAAIESLTTSRPLAAVVQAMIDDTIVVTESSAFSPRSLALGLERVFPGIAEAADRLHVRIDCEWSTLN